MNGRVSTILQARANECSAMNSLLPRPLISSMRFCASLMLSNFFIPVDVLEVVYEAELLQLRDKGVSRLELGLQRIDERRGFIGIDPLEIDELALQES